MSDETVNLGHSAAGAVIVSRLLSTGNCHTHCRSMRDELRTRLIAAATTGEIVTVVYHWGSQPGSVRNVVPIALSDEEVRAHDVAAGADKTFKLAHLELAWQHTTARATTPPRPSRTHERSRPPLSRTWQACGRSAGTSKPPRPLSGCIATSKREEA